MPRLSNDEFLAEMGKLLRKAGEKDNPSSVSLTMKHVVEEVVQNKGKKNENVVEEARCLIRARSGKCKISTVVRPRNRVQFSIAYSTILKSNLKSLSSH
ncbi:uncharacterized protein AMSG_03928 [Thecamonas trahens ATCC 50062]|uniref:Signal recognition particle 14 kDa protein n=1 Tax=Thecamonas trahens ATCC 50062 TaxID=461836 RepID=A0A0L0D5Q2_THETB|nr:hypothetical protein AMSG_03928 [Thecamonas trahens ATCC 50062]KNC47697.1 hypothetical protein AMSG_03928 [Thecamonas trahens ATCC 50062]|eukprot:XP_013759179.1 hypothetical protein AMSG_03928 [Thecamonas trahens ATCC 50062]